jgi:hypothetical protein
LKTPWWVSVRQVWDVRQGTALQQGLCGATEHSTALKQLSCTQIYWLFFQKADKTPLC